MTDAVSEALAYCADMVRTADSDRYATVPFAPSDRRPGLLALYAFNVEVAKTREVVSQQLLGSIRLQWWRESLEGIYAGTPRTHRSEEHTSELQSLMRISYAVFCLKKKKKN